MTELFSKELLTKVLASIPNNIEQLLVVRDDEPHLFNLLKLMIRAFLNNILRSQFISVHGNDWFKALWLLQNIYSAQRIFEQYNYLDLYPYIDENHVQLPSFPTFSTHNNDVNYNLAIMTERLPYLMGAVNTMRHVRTLVKAELVQRLYMLAQDEKNTIQNYQTLATNLMFDVGEYDSSFDKFVALFMVDDDDDTEEKQEANNKNKRRKLATIKPRRFNERSICVLSQMQDGGKLLTFLPQL